MFRKSLAVLALVGLAALLAIIFFWGIYINDCHTWLFHLGAGFFIAMYLRISLKKLSGISCLVLVYTAAICWEFFEHDFLVKSTTWPPGSILDIWWTAAGGLVYNVVHFLLARWFVLKRAIRG